MALVSAFAGLSVMVAGLGIELDSPPPAAPATPAVDVAAIEAPEIDWQEKISRFAIGEVIVCGLSVGTLFTLFVLPALYTYIASDHRKAAAKHAEQQKAIEALQTQPKEA